MAGAVPHPRGDPPAVSPVLGRLRAFAALLGGGQRPSPTGAMKRGVAPLWPGCGGRRFWPLCWGRFPLARKGNADRDASQLDVLRWQCVQEVKKTNGSITFKDTLTKSQGDGP